MIKQQQEPFQPDRQVAQDVDGQGNALNIWYCNNLGGSPCMPLFLRTWGEIMDSGFSRKYISWGEGNKYKAVYCTSEDNSKVLGGIAFEYLSNRQEGWIILSFTDTKERGRRINQVMHKYFEKAVRRMGGTRIGSHISVNNTSRLKAAERVGFKPAYYRMEKMLPLEDTRSEQDDVI